MKMVPAIPNARSHGRGNYAGYLGAAAACAALTLAAPGRAPAAAAAAAAADGTETIVMIRHGEKPEAGLGQLDCQGLNRALALPAVLKRQFGVPDALFAPDPAVMKTDSGKPYDYIRPLATIEPSAIAFGMPVNTSIGVADWAALARLLQTPPYAHALVIVAWEHSDIVKLARAIVTAQGGDPGRVPEWNGKDFDSIYVLRIARDGTGGRISFERRQEGLNGQKLTCPGAQDG